MDQSPMDRDVRRWIVEVLEQHRELLAIALRQRAKFEGWLKFELAACAESHGATNVEVEAPTGLGARADLTFIRDGKRYDVELKTSNTNWRMGGVLARTRPITKNIKGVITDGGKLRNCKGDGIVAFCLFPVEAGHTKWIDYLTRIGFELGVNLTADEHTSRVTVPLKDEHQADIVVATFLVPKAILNDIAQAGVSQ
jgi:hypothetical protein